MFRRVTGIAVALMLVQPVAGYAIAPDARSERVQFAKGATSTVIKGQIKGYRFVDYQVRAGAVPTSWRRACQRP